MQVYDVPDATNPEPARDASVFLNGMIDNVLASVNFLTSFLDARTRAALHAPTSKDWTLSFQFVFGNLGGKRVHELDYASAECRV